MQKIAFFYLFAATVSVYLWMSFVGINPVGLLIALLLPLIPLRFSHPKFSRPTGIGLVSSLAILAQIAVMAAVLSPLVITQKIDGFTFVQFTGINDFYKHIYALTAILQTGLPAVHPYYPSASFSYYYGYYLIPAAIAQITHLHYNVVMFLYPLLTTGFSLIFLASLVRKYLPSKSLQILAIIILIVGTGLDIIPTRKINSPNIRHIESWSQELDLGLIVNNTFMSYIWVPQHVLAAIALIYLAYLLHTQDTYDMFDSAMITLGLVFIGLTSFFVAITAIFWLGTLFVLKKSARKPLIISAIIATILAIPYLHSLSNRNNLFAWYVPGFYTFVPNAQLLNRFLNLVIEYGPVTFIAGIACLVWAKAWPKKLAVVTMVVLPIGITWFIRTPGPNDFGMRSILPLQLLAPLAALMLIQGIKAKWLKVLLLGLVLVNIGGSSLGYAFEHVYSWKDRRRLNVTESELITWLRTQPSTLRVATYQKEDWGFYIPPLGFKTNLNPHLYDSGVYVAGASGPTHSQFELLGKEIFSNTSKGATPDEVLRNRENSWKKLPTYISWSPFDTFIVSQKEWVRKGVNPWFTMFAQIGTTPILIGKSFATFPSADLIQKISDTQISIDQKSAILLSPKNQNVVIPPGLWYVVACSKTNKIMVDFEQYFSLIEANQTAPGCAGNVFISADSEPIRISGSYSADSLILYKVLITKK